jgi:hypothetical protein
LAEVKGDMSLSTHQRNVVSFFKSNSTGFIEFLLNTTDNQLTLIEDFFPHVVKFLDRELRQEVVIYQYQSQGYNRVIDMLIEVHIVGRDSETGENLIREAKAIFHPA